MNHSKLDDRLNELWAGIIEDMDFNILKNSISFDIKTVDKDIIRKYKLVFLKVSSFYFLNECGQDRFNIRNPESDDVLEMTSIGWYPNGIGKIKLISSKSWAEDCCSSANFVIEIWSSTLLIEARSISVNNEIFEVGYPIDT